MTTVILERVRKSKRPNVMSLKRIILLLIYLASFCAPIGATGVSIHTTIGEISLFRLFFFLAVMMACVRCLAFGRGIKLYNRKTQYSILFYIVWIMYSAITVVWAKDLNNYIKIMFFLLTGFLCILLISDYCRTDELNNVLRALNAGLLLQCILGYYEFFSGNYLFLKQESVDIYFSRDLHYPVAMMGNPNDFSTGMFLGIVACLYLYQIMQNRKPVTLFYLSCIAAYIVAIGLSDSKACLGGAVACIAFFIYKKRKKSSRILVVFLFLVVLMTPAVQSYIYSKLDLTYFYVKGESFSNRVNLIRNGFDFLMRTCGFGVGNGQIEYWVENNAVFNTGNILNMHNWWMEILTAYGWIIFTGFILFYIKLFYGFMAQYKHNSDSYYGKQMLAFSAGLVGMILALMSSSSNMTKEYIWLFWAVLIAFQKQDVVLLSTEGVLLT